MVLVASPLFTRNTPMRNDGTAMWSLAMGIRILHRRRCTGGLWRATRPTTITPDWAKLPRNFERLIRPACGRASPFRGCINTNKSTGKDRFAATPRLTGKPVVNPPWAKERGLAPENFLIKWRSHAGCGSNVSTMCLLLHLQHNWHTGLPKTSAKQQFPTDSQSVSPFLLESVLPRSNGKTRLAIS